MSNTDQYAQIGRGLFPDVATDLVTFRQQVHPEMPSLPRYTVTVSRADVETQRARGKFRVPTRNKSGVRLAAVWDRLKTERARNAFAVKHGWPFMVHLANLDSAEEVQP